MQESVYWLGDGDAEPVRQMGRGRSKGGMFCNFCVDKDPWGFMKLDVNGNSHL